MQGVSFVGMETGCALTALKMVQRKQGELLDRKKKWLIVKIKLLAY